MIKGESYTIEVAFNDEYDISRIEEIQLAVNYIVVGSLKSDTIIPNTINTYLCQIPGNITDTFKIGNNIISLYLDDSIRGIIKKNVSSLNIDRALNINTDESINTGINMLINVTVGETDVTTEYAYFNAIRGRDAYESYLATTTDDPPMTEAEWSSGGGRTTNYNDLNNKPQINNIELSGSKTAAELGLATSEQGTKADTALQILPAGTVIDPTYSQLKSKVAGIEENANNYAHPEKHPTTILEGVDPINGNPSKFLNERGEFASPSMSAIEHGATTNKNGEVDFQHITQAEKDSMIAASVFLADFVCTDSFELLVTDDYKMILNK